MAERKSNAATGHSTGTPVSPQSVTPPPPGSVRPSQPIRAGRRSHCNIPAWIQAIAAILLVGITFMYTRYAQKQWEAMEKSVQETGSIIQLTKTQIANAQANAIKNSAQIDRSIGASNRLADAGEKANGLAAEEERPWIGAVGTTATPPILEGKASRITLAFVNAGRRPARVFDLHGRSHIYTTFPDNPPWIISKGAPTIISHSVNVPGLPIQMQWPIEPLTAQEIEMVKSGTARFYVYGKVDYVDIRTNEKHTTNACYFYIPIVDNFGSCPEYNDAN
jgi:hypothetical protein